jgi:hypothetical protein
MGQTDVGIRAQWSDWLPLRAYARAPRVGLYRIRGSASGLVYVGEGAIQARLLAHLRKAAADPVTAAAQENVFKEAGPLEYSAVEGRWERHQRFELETDLIAAHLCQLGYLPPAQFMG